MNASFDVRLAHTSAIPHHAAIWSPETKRFYQKLQAKRHILAAMKTMANKLPKASCHMLKRQEPFDVTRACG